MMTGHHHFFSLPITNMPLLNGFEPQTQKFLKTFGTIAGLANIASLAFITLSIFSIVTNVLRMDPSTPRERKAMCWLRKHKVLVIVLSIVTLWALWLLGRMVVSNTELAGIVGLGSLLKLVFL